VAAGFSGIGVADSGGMDRAVKRGPKNSRKRAGKSRLDEASPGKASAHQSSADKSGTTRVRIETAIRSIPCGKVSTYGAIARAAGLPGAARQVAAILRRGFGLPWQRVLGSGGEIKLRGDSAIEQRFRLEAEGVRFRGPRVDMKAHEFKFGRVG
jgi:methylated-DNA-protein-cysteine methyltransferase related protein